MTRTKRVRDKKAGRPPKLQSAVRVEVLLEQQQKDALALLARQSGLSMNDVIREAISSFLGEEEA